MQERPERKSRIEFVGQHPWYVRPRLEHFGGWAGTALLLIAGQVISHQNFDENWQFAGPVAGYGFIVATLFGLGSIPSPFIAVRKILVPATRRIARTGAEAAAALKRKLSPRATKKPSTDTE